MRRPRAVREGHRTSPRGRTRAHQPLYGQVTHLNARNVQQFLIIGGWLSVAVAVYLALLLGAVAMLGDGGGLLVGYGPLVGFAAAVIVRRRRGSS